MDLCGKQAGQTHGVVRRTHQLIGRRGFTGVLAFPRQAATIESSTHMFYLSFSASNQLVLIEKVRKGEPTRIIEHTLYAATASANAFRIANPTRSISRSEERRVGKECRS